MALATASTDAHPSVRFVLLKAVDEQGFVFFTNYHSRKAGDLDSNPHVSSAIFWPNPPRQVRIEGTIERLAAEESDAYFRTRDRPSQIGAVASPQSCVIADREELEHMVAETAGRYAGQNIPRPGHWGGYRIEPNVMEFWAGRPNRLHDRIRYRLEVDGGWTIVRLAP